MSQSATFAEVAFPSRWRVAGVELQPFTLGHALLMERIGLAGQPFSPSNLLLALWCCSRPATEAFTGLGGARFRALVALWKVQLSLVGWNFDAAAEALNRYMSEAWTGPSVTEREGSKAIGAPTLIALVCGVQLHYGRTMAQAIATPVRQALFELAFWSSAGGGLEWVSDSEDDAIARMLEAASV